MNVFFDLESCSAPDDILAKVKPVFTAPANYKKADVIAANIAEQEATWRERAALDATTCRVLVIGLITKDHFQTIEGDEKSNLEEFWRWAVVQLEDECTIVGFNIFGFDLPMLVRRSYINSVKVPPIIRHGRYWNELFVDVMDLWTCGNREQRISLSLLGRSLGLGDKLGEGKDFAALWNTDRAAALKYLERDLSLTRDCYLRMTS